MVRKNKQEAEKVTEKKERSTVARKDQRSQPTESQFEESDEVPLCVDLDGTLVYSDTSWESVIRLLRRWPWMVVCFPFWLLRGRAHFKAEVASRVAFEPEHLGYIEEILEFLKEEKAKGRSLVLAANQSIADIVSRHLGLFDRALGSDEKINLKGLRKAETLVDSYGRQGFDYVGNDQADIAVWEQARIAYVVNASEKLRRRMGAWGSHIEKLPMLNLNLFDFARALRMHHWIKNALLLVPLVAAHRFTDISEWIKLMIGIVAFGVCASSAYLVNDLLDIESDRRHRSKRARVIASGKLRISKGIYLALGLLVVGVLLALGLPEGFLACLLIYWLGANLYSLFLKQIYLVDVVVLAGLYFLRILSGAEIVDVVVSPWLFIFSLFFFLSLALSKRYVELLRIADLPVTKIAGRGYGTGDGWVVLLSGAGSGVLSIIVLAFYMNSGHIDTLYRKAEFIWIGVLLTLVWISRVWYRAKRGLLDDDPIIFAIKDRTSYVILGLIMVCVLLSSPILGR